MTIQIEVKGASRTGKTTLLQLIRDWLDRAGYTITNTNNPHEINVTFSWVGRPPQT